MATALTSELTRFTDKCNNVLAGGIVKTFEPNSLTPKTTYQNPECTIPNFPEVTLDETGRAKIYILGDYRIQVYSRDGILIEDNLLVEQTLVQRDFVELSQAVQEQLTNELQVFEVEKGEAIQDLLKHGGRAYPTLALANADIANIALDTKVSVLSETEGGDYYKATAGATSLTKSPYDPLTQAKTDAAAKYTPIAKTAALETAVYKMEPISLAEYGLSSTTALGTGDVFIILKTYATALNLQNLTLKIQETTLANFSITLYEMDVNAKVLRTIGIYPVTTATIGINTLSVSGAVLSGGNYLAVGLPSGIKLAYGGASTTTSGFKYVNGRADSTSLNTGTTLTTQTFTNLAVGLGFSGTTSVAYPLAYASDITTIDSRVTTNENNISNTLFYNEDFNSSGYTLVTKPTNGNGELFIHNNAYTYGGILNTAYINVQSILNAATNFNVVFYSIDANNKIIAKSSTYNIPITGTVVHTVSDINFTVPAGTYLAIGVEAGKISIGYTNNNTPNNTSGFIYFYGNANAITFAVGATVTGTKQTFATAACGFGCTVFAKYPYDLTTFAKPSDLAAYHKNKLNGKKLVAIGDSMVYGHNLGTSKTWLSKLAARNNMTAVNYGINGNRLTNTGGNGEPLINRYTSMDNDADYVVIFIGTNDAAASVTIGDDNFTDTATFKGALNVLCDGLLTKYPTKKIGFITPYRRNSNYPAYIDAIKTICKKYSIPVFDNYEKGGVCWTNTTQVSSLTLGDTYHLNEAGMEYVSYKYEDFLMSL